RTEAKAARGRGALASPEAAPHPAPRSPRRNPLRPPRCHHRRPPRAPNPSSPCCTSPTIPAPTPRPISNPSPAPPAARAASGGFNEGAGSLSGLDALHLRHPEERVSHKRVYARLRRAMANEPPQVGLARLASLRTDVG